MSFKPSKGSKPNAPPLQLRHFVRAREIRSTIENAFA
uniref:Uncharacterized protein n=1 Tax=Arundo donax TaxID=35708 RepID=A0A0A9F8D2_ARUDO